MDVRTKGHSIMIISDIETREPEPDDGSFRIAMMAGALVFAGMFGALFAEVQSFFA